MKGRLLPVAILGLVFFLGVIAWQWNQYSSKQYKGTPSKSTYGRKEDVVDQGTTRGSNHRKLGLQQADPKALDHHEAKRSTTLSREAFGNSDANATLSNPAIILFCYDR